MFALKVLPFLFLAPWAQARVFDINAEKFAGYVTVSGGTSSLGTGALDGETSGTPSYSGSVNYNYGGEFGLMYCRPGASLRFGFELIRPTVLDSAAKSGTTDLYAAQSEILGYAPKITLEVNLSSARDSRSFISVGAGAGNITMENEYTLTTAGQSAYPGVGDHKVEAKGSATLLTAALGYERELADTTTLTIEFGYRQMKVDNLAYTKDVRTFSGDKLTGEKVEKNTGELRTFDFSGGFIAMGFRFYL